MARTDTPAPAPRLIVFAAVCVTVAALYFARDVLIPLALAALLSFLLAPLVARLERGGVPRVPAVIVVFVVLLALVALLGWLVYVQVEDLADQIPRYQNEITAKVRSVAGNGERGTFEKAAEAIEDVTTAVTTDFPASAPASTAPADTIAGILTRIDERIGGRDPAGTLDNPLYVRPVPQRQSWLQYLQGYIPSVLGIVGTAGLVLVFVLFILFTREDLRDRLIRLIGYGQLHVTTQALDDAATRISRYLVAQAIVNGSYGLTIALGLWAIGYFLGGGEVFPNFVLWGLLCALLRFIPYVGPWIAAAFPIAVAFAVFPGYTVFATVGAMFIVVELLSNNFMEPWLYGSSTGMSTVAVLVAAVFWTWLWGPIGLVMATPLTVCLVVIGKYVPQLGFFDILLGDEPALAPHQRVYQRLLAMDQEEATAILQEYRADMPLEVMFDDLLLPALALAEVDRHANRLDERRSVFIRTALRQIIEEMADDERVAVVRREAERTERRARGESEPASTASSASSSASSASASSASASSASSASPAQPSNGEDDSPPPPRARLPRDCAISVVLLPAHDPADEIAALMLAQLLELRGFGAVPVSHNALASEMLAEVERRKPDVVVVSALPPAAVAHARYLCKRLRDRFGGEVNTVVGLWTVKGDLKKARERIVCSDRVRLTTTFAESLQQIHEMVQPKLLAANARGGMTGAASR